MSAGTIGVVFTARDRRSRGKAPASASNSTFHHTKCIAGDHEPGDTLVIGNSDGLHKVGSVGAPPSGGGRVRRAMRPYDRAAVRIAVVPIAASVPPYLTMRSTGAFAGR